MNIYYIINAIYAIGVWISFSIIHDFALRGSICEEELSGLEILFGSLVIALLWPIKFPLIYRISKAK